MQNRKGFVPKKYLQPLRYGEAYEGYYGEYLNPFTKQLFHLQMETHRSGLNSLDILAVVKNEHGYVYRKAVNRQAFYTLKSAFIMLDKILLSNIKFES